MLVCEPLIGWRVIAEPPALDSAPWPTGSHVVRISPDDVFLIGAATPSVPADPHAIITPEHGFSGATLDVSETDDLAVHHIEWHLPDDRPALAQGQLAGVPAKLVLHADGSAMLLVATAAHQELEDRVNGTGS